MLPAMPRGGMKSTRACVCAVSPGQGAHSGGSKGDAGAVQSHEKIHASGPSTMVRAILALLPLLAALLAGCLPERSSTGVTSPTLRRIRARGLLVCGINGQLPGFSSLSAQGQYEGFDVDLCHAVAAGLGEGVRLETRPISLPERFAALSSGEVDLLARNLTMNLSRDAPGGNAVTFAPILYFDGGAIMVPRSAAIHSLADLAGRTICVMGGSTNEQVLADRMRQNRLPYTPVRYRSADDAFSAYQAGRCAAITSDRSGLAARRSRFTQPREHRLLDEVLSKEPQAAATVQGDPAWADQVRWVMATLIEAEERGISQANVEDQLALARRDLHRADLRRFLGLEGNLGRLLGLPADFTVRVIRSVGNYGEIHNRHLGEASPLHLERGPNRLWRDGGLLIAPPFR
jgi:general L-amino acid transport system substrate-binding protein